MALSMIARATFDKCAATRVLRHKSRNELSSLPPTPPADGDAQAAEQRPNDHRGRLGNSGTYTYTRGDRSSDEQPILGVSSAIWIQQVCAILIAPDPLGVSADTRDRAP